AESRRRCIFTGVLLIPLAILSQAQAIAARPDAAVSIGLRLGWPTQVLPRIALVLIAAAVVAQVLAMVSGPTLERQGFMLVGVFRGLGLAGWCLLSELLAAAEGVGGGRIALIAAVAARLLLGLGGGESLPWVRPRLGLLAAAGLILYALTIPRAL